MKESISSRTQSIDTGIDRKESKMTEANSRGKQQRQMTEENNRGK
jgi:hypothetical protein